MKQLFFFILLFLSLPLLVFPQDAEYEEINNIVVMEAENLDSAHLWKTASVSADFSGSGYIVWENGSFFNAPGNGKIDVKIKINDPGKYQFQWRSQVGKGTNGTEHNDTWLRFADAADFYGERNGNRVYPKGTGKTPNPNGSSSDGWFKIYRSGNAAWSWQATTSDHDGRNIYVEFDTPGIYTMELSARSDFHIIDRIVLSKNYTNPTDLSIPETPFINNTTALQEVEINLNKNVIISPNPISSIKNNFIKVSGLELGYYSLEIYDVSGKLVFSQRIKVNENNAPINLEPLNPGHYIARFKNAKVARSVKLISK